MDIAKLGIEIDTRDVKRAQGALGKFTQSAKKTESASQRMERQHERTAKQLKMLGLAAGAAAGAMAALGAAFAIQGVRKAAQFQKELTKVNTLVGVSRREIQGYSKDILGLAGSVGIAPGELARALFAVTSAGIKGAEAMDLLRSSSTAAAIGLGDTRDIALAAGAAVTAYGKENLSTAAAVDIMVGTVEQGNLEASQLAGVLGRVLGLAAQAGVSFRDAGAFIAAFTRQGVDAAQAVTGLRGTISLLTRRPTEEMERAFAQMGFTVAEFRKEVEDDGFISAFQNLVNRANDAGIQMGRIVPEVEALSGVLSVFASNGESAADIADKIGQSVGTLESRFRAALEQDPTIAINQMRASMEALQIQIGQYLLPALGDFAEFLGPRIQRASDWMTDNATEIRAAILGISVAFRMLTRFGESAADKIENAFIKMQISINRALAGLAGDAAQIAEAIPGQSDVANALRGYEIAFNTLANIQQDAIRDVQTFAEIAAEEMDRYKGKVFELVQAQLELERQSGETQEAVESVIPDPQGIEEQAQTTREWTDYLADLRAEMGGPLAQAILDYERSLRDLDEAYRNNEINLQDMNEAQALLEERLSRAGIALARDFMEPFRDFLAQLPFGTQLLDQFNLAMGESANIASASGSMLSSIGSGFAQSVFNGQGIRDSLSSAFTGAAGQELSSTIDTFFSDAMEKGIGEAFDNSRTQEGMAAGFALAIGQAVGGNLGQAAFTAAGTAIAGPIGGMIGSIIGDLLFGESVPKFQAYGAGGQMDMGTDLTIGTRFGEQLNFAFREIEDQAADQVVRGYSQFLTTLSGVIRDPEDQAGVASAIRAFGVSSRSGPDSIEGQLNLLLDDILLTFDGFTREFVNMGATLEERVQRLADVFAVENRLILGMGFGLGAVGGSVAPGPVAPGPGNPPIIDPPNPGPGPSPFPGEGLPGERIGATGQAAAFGAVLNGVGDAAAVTNPQLQATLQLLDELRIGGESLAQTFDRLFTVTEALDRAMGLIGNQIADSREGVVRFGAELVAIFGDDAGALSGMLDRIIRAAFTEAEIAQQTIDAARQKATDLLTSLGITVTEEMFSADGLQGLLEDYFGNLNPENTATLLAALDAIATLIDAEAELADMRGEVVESTRDAAAIAEILAGLELDATRAGMSGLELALFNLNTQQSDLRDELIELGATEAELARLTELFSGERLRIIEDFNQQAAAAERQRIAELDALLFNAGAAGVSAIDPMRAEFIRMASAMAGTMQAAIELGATEEQLAMLRLSHQFQIAAFADTLSQSIEDLNDRLFGAPEAMQDLSSGIQQAANSARNFRDAWLAVVDQINGALDAQLLNTSTLTAAERQAESERQFFDALAAAEGGDLNAAQQLTQLFQQAIGEGANFFGTTTSEFAALEDRLRAALEGADLPIPPESPERQTAINTAATAQAVQQVELSALEQAMLARQLVSQIDLLAGLQETTPDEIAQRYGVQMAELIGVLTGTVPDLTGDALSGYFNDVVTATGESLNQMAQLESIGLDQLLTQEQILNELVGLKNLIPYSETIGGPGGTEVGFTGSAETTASGGGFQMTAAPTAPAVTVNIDTQEIRQAIAEAVEALREGNDQRLDVARITEQTSDELGRKFDRLGRQLVRSRTDRPAPVSS